MHVIRGSPYDLFCFRIHVESIGYGVDDRSPLNSHLRIAIHLCAALFGDGNGGDVRAWICETLLPQRNSAAQVVRVEGIHAVMLCCDENYVVRASTDGNVRHVQRLSYYVSIHAVSA